ncbi:MAG: IS200/IS605 family transposase [Oscillospiraceae bacterium]|nr:IS200/IS605 family transposase [Oscillospiraceae bacterium]
MKDERSLSHTKWKCQYHIVLVPKYRRKVIYKELRKDIGIILRKLCEYKKVEIIEAHAMPDHIHMLVSIPPKLAVSDFVGYLKGKSTLMIFERHANMKYKYGRRVFWAKGYYVSTVGGNKKAIEEYIRNQEMEDQMMDQLSFKEYEDPFKDAKSIEDDDSPEIPSDSRIKYR